MGGGSWSIPNVSPDAAEVRDQVLHLPAKRERAVSISLVLVRFDTSSVRDYRIRLASPVIALFQKTTHV